MPKTTKAWLLVFWSLIALQIGLAYSDGFLFQFQIAAQGYSARGLAFVGHGQMWGDILLSVLLALLIELYSQQWTKKHVVVGAVISLIVSGLLHNLYAVASVEIPGCHAHEGSLTPAGWVHFVYQAAAFEVLLLFFFASRSDPSDVEITTGILILHLLVGAIEIPLYLGSSPLNWLNVLQTAGGIGIILLSALFASRKTPIR